MQLNLAGLFKKLTTQFRHILHVLKGRQANDLKGARTKSYCLQAGCKHIVRQLKLCKGRGEVFSHSFNQIF